MNTPIPYRVDLSKSLMKIQDESTKDQEALRASMPSSPAPTTSVADVTRITTNRSTDLIAVIKDIDTKTRKSKKEEMIADIVLVDRAQAREELRAKGPLKKRRIFV